MPDWRKVREISTGWPDDGRPWFLTQTFPPPLDRQVRAIWPNGWQAIGFYRAGTWDFSGRPFDPMPPGYPVGWKPEEMWGMPEPFDYGLRVF